MESSFRSFLGGSPQEAERLWVEFSKKPNVENRNLLVTHYIPLVRTVVLRLFPTYRKHVDFDDLMSCGLLGLMDALDKFDLSKGVKFEAYATLRIRGEIIDQIRKQDWAPVNLRQKIKKIEEAYDYLELQLGRIPNEKEVAEHLKMQTDEVQKALDDSHTFNLVALDELFVERLGAMPLSDEGNPDTLCDEKEVKRIMAEVIDTLSETEKLVISMYYYDELTMREIAEVFGVCESRVSQIHAKTLMIMRNKMTKAFES
ncbi:MAG: FliA/WhiG family RNA polymerase sigma factor [Oscillospiraceae bacterium]|nr:FliA/WhiG family RNA polymerase sigma factor [Oscillospiraceae bacterium]